MPSLDGYSLNEEIKKLRKDLYEELHRVRTEFVELTKHCMKLSQQLNTILAKNVKPKKARKDIPAEEIN